MRISRVHIDVELVAGEEVLLDRLQSHYLKHVLRLKSGAALVLFNGRDAIDYQARLVFDGRKVSARIDGATPLHNESGLDSEIIQGLGRGDHITWMIQKTTELGVNRILLFNSEHTQSPFKPAQMEKKLTHWRSVAVSACEQSGRALLPQIYFHTRLDQAIAASTIETRLLLDSSGAPLASVLRPPCSALSLLIGPEGGLSPAEIRLARTTGFTAAGLGPRVLRTETAATTAIAIAQSILGDLC